MNQRLEAFVVGRWGFEGAAGVELGEVFPLRVYFFKTREFVEVLEFVDLGAVEGKDDEEDDGDGEKDCEEEEVEADSFAGGEAEVKRAHL